MVQDQSPLDIAHTRTRGLADLERGRTDHHREVSRLRGTQPSNRLAQYINRATHSVPIRADANSVPSARASLQMPLIRRCFLKGAIARRAVPDHVLKFVSRKLSRQQQIDIVPHIGGW